jgi:uncharacterized protein (TIGR03067 family)
MRSSRFVGGTLLGAALVCLLSAVEVRAQSGRLPVGPDAQPHELLGRWSLIAVIRDGEDTTRNGLTQGAVAAVYDFKSDGTFSIMVGEKTSETGTWSANATVVPKIFDHMPNLPNGKRPLVPGIYEVGGEAMKMCLLPASEANTHPTKCEARGANRSSIYIFKRSANSK